VPLKAVSVAATVFLSAVVFLLSGVNEEGGCACALKVKLAMTVRINSRNGFFMAASVPPRDF